MSARSSFRSRASAAVGTHPVKATADSARRLVDHRLAAASDYPDMEEARDEARRIRLHTLANLDQYLARFAKAVEANGGVVHWASEADEANSIIVRIAADAGARSAVKAKSMVTEEIELNDALEAAGVDVVETDLGEFIIQLAGDKPSHIIAPVMHMTRHDVGALFEDRLGIAPTSDPKELNAAARAPPSAKVPRGRHRHQRRQFRRRRQRFNFPCHQRGKWASHHDSARACTLR